MGYVHKVILIYILSLFLTGCYTQLSMFYPEPEIEQESQLFYETYSRAVPRLNVSAYAQNGAGTPLGLAYTTMFNRFNGGYGGYVNGYYNKYDYYNRFGYHAGYNGYDTYQLAGYTMYVPTTISQGERKARTFSTDRNNNSPGTNLNTTRTRQDTNSNTDSNNGYSNSSNITRSSTSTSSSSSGGRRVTKRN